MYYEKRIRYIDYLENGEKKRNCGYVKMTVADGSLLLEMQIRDLYETDDVASEVVTAGGGAEERIGTVLIRQGSGSFRWERSDQEHRGEEIPLGEKLRYGQLERIQVQLSPRRSLRCVWRTAESAPADQDSIPAMHIAENTAEELQPEPQPEPQIKPQPESQISEPQSQLELREPGLPPEPPEVQPEQPESESAQSELQSELLPESESAQSELPPQLEPVQSEPRPEPSPPESPQAEPPQSGSPQRELQPPRMASMSENKWQQLQNIYPRIRPFQDQREYLSLRPEDFVILHSSAYRLAQNSFLLHGYFNYDHLILTRVSQKGEDRFYIGVPGNFFEKEKQVAIMYGFGSFECRQEPAREGEFGYYMIQVEL